MKNEGATIGAPRPLFKTQIEKFNCKKEIKIQPAWAN
jgi:hypothetical protein